LDLSNLGARSALDGRVFLLDPPLERLGSLRAGPPDWLLRREPLAAQVAVKDSRTPNSRCRFCISVPRVHNANTFFNCSGSLLQMVR